MKSSTAAFLLASICALTSASPVKSRQTTESSAFTIVAARSGSPIHLQTVQASGQAFWIGKETTTYCPPQVDAEGNCPPGTQTVLAGGDSTISLVSKIPSSYRFSSPAFSFVLSFSSSRFPGTDPTEPNISIRNRQLTSLCSLGCQRSRRPASLRRAHWSPGIHPGPFLSLPPWIRL